MPFKSEAQRRWMHHNNPQMAKEWESETPKDAKLPERLKAKPTFKQRVNRAFPNR